MARACMAWRSQIHILFNNAGIAERGEFESLSLEQWNQQIAVNLTAPFRSDGQGLHGVAVADSHPVQQCRHCRARGVREPFTRAVEPADRSQPDRALPVQPAPRAGASGGALGRAAVRAPWRRERPGPSSSRRTNPPMLPAALSPWTAVARG